MPEHKFTRDAKKVNNLDKKKLKEMKAEEFTKGKSNILMNYLNTHKDLPIVAHYAKYDRDKVLYRAFKKVGNLDKLPPKERWRCTFDLACSIPDIKDTTLDGVLDYCNYERRDNDQPHNALTDCVLTAQIYMKMMTRPPPPVSKLGF